MSHVHVSSVWTIAGRVFDNYSMHELFLCFLLIRQCVSWPEIEDIVFRTNPSPSICWQKPACLHVLPHTKSARTESTKRQKAAKSGRITSKTSGRRSKQAHLTYGPLPFVQALFRTGCLPRKPVHIFPSPTILTVPTLPFAGLLSSISSFLCGFYVAWDDRADANGEVMIIV